MSVFVDEILTFLQAIPPFQFLEGPVLVSLVESMSMDFFPKDTVILKEKGQASEALYIIKKGGVKIAIQAAGGEDMVIDYRGAGETFGLVSLMSSVQKTTVVAVEDSICYLVGKKKILELIDSTPVFTEYFLKSHFSSYIDKTYREMGNRSLFYGSSDQLLFTSRVGDIAVKGVVTAPEDVSIQAAAQLMVQKKVSSLVITGEDDRPSGIVTDRDLRNKVVAGGMNINRPVATIMSLPLHMVDAGDFCFEAVLRMLRHNIHHVLVMKDGALQGVLTNHDLLILQGKSPLSFAKDIEKQPSIAGLTSIAGKVNQVVRILLKEGATAGNITKIISELNDRLVRRILELSVARFGPPPLPFCWIVFGSEGRKEQTFKTDQDNAIIFANPASEEELGLARSYFSALTPFVRDTLVDCGFPLCPADNMASNPDLCQPLDIWKKYFSSWIANPTPEAVLKSLIFFDFRPIYGDPALAEELRVHQLNRLKGQNVFLARIAATILKNRPPLGFFKNFIVGKRGEHKDEINLKINGIGPLVDIVRLYALESGVVETPTLERLAALRVRHAVVRELGDELVHLFEFVNLLRIHHQMEQLGKGQEPNNFINPEKLSNLEKKSLREGFQLIGQLQDGLVAQYGPGLVGG